jgi:glycine/sarcosine/betaine reductase complex component A
MDLQEQERIIRIVEDNGGTDGLLVVLGSPDAESAELYAETVTIGDPTYAGPLAGVSLKLPVYHIIEPEMKSAIPSEVYSDQIEMMEVALDAEGISAAMRSLRERVAEME